MRCNELNATSLSLFPHVTRASAEPLGDMFARGAMLRARVSCAVGAQAKNISPTRAPKTPVFCVPKARAQKPLTEQATGPATGAGLTQDVINTFMGMRQVKVKDVARGQVHFALAMTANRALPARCVSNASALYTHVVCLLLRARKKANADLLVGDKRGWPDEGMDEVDEDSLRVLVEDGLIDELHEDTAPAGIGIAAAAKELHCKTYEPSIRLVNETKLVYEARTILRGSYEKV